MMKNTITRQVFAFFASIFILPFLFLISSTIFSDFQTGLRVAIITLPFCAMVALLIGLPVTMILKRANLVKFRFILLIPMIFTFIVSSFVLKIPNNFLNEITYNRYFGTYTGSLIIIFIMSSIAASTYWIIARPDLNLDELS